MKLETGTSHALPFDRPSVGMPLPGPASAVLLERQAQRESNARTYPRRLPIAIKRGAGSYVEDLDGNVFIDFLTGAGTLSLGHSHPEVVEAVQRQLPLLAHGLDFPTEVKDEFATVQLSMLPEAMRATTKMQFCGPTGANAVEAALKLCKTATGRGDVISFQGAFHGSTHSTLSITGLVSQKEPIANAMPGVHFFPFPYAQRSPLGGDPETLAARCVEYFERSLKDPFGGIAKPAAVILEVVQGEGGNVPAPPVFVQGLRRVTRELDIPLIVDEIQCGCGRTGTWFAFEQSGIVPDVIVSSKALGGIGMPIAVIFYDERLDAWAPGAHTATFRGNQLAFAAGIAAARIIERDDVLENVREQGAYAMEVLQELASRYELISDVRGLGLMLGLELVDPLTGEPDGQAARTVQRAALERGLILEVGGREDTVVRMLPPLNVTRTTLVQAFEILDAALQQASR